MTLNTTDKMVTADKRKGMVQVEQTDDQLMHFKWKDRTTNTTEDDLIIFPDDIEFKKVTSAPASARVYLLKFMSSNKRMFFWMQDPKDDKDEENCKKVNEFLNNPPAPGSNRGAGSGSGGSGAAGIDLNNLGDSELQSLLNNMSQQQLMQLFGGGLSGGMGGLASLLGGGGGGGGGSSQSTPTTGGRQRSNAGNRPGRGTAEPATPAASTATPAPIAAASAAAATPANSAPSKATPGAPTKAGKSGGDPPIKLQDLQSILSGIQVPPGEGEQGEQQQVNLASGLTAEVMQPLLSNPDFVKRMQELLPEADEIKGTVSSPQFQQALGVFCSAFQSAQLAPLIREFDLGDAAIAAAAAGDLEAFVKALEAKQKKTKEDEPEDMALDWTLMCPNFIRTK